MSSLSGSALFPQLAGVFDQYISKNITFRPLARCDAFPLYVATQHPEFNQYLLWSAPQQEAEIVPQIDKLLREQTLRRAMITSFCDKSTGLWKGLTALRPFRDGVEMGLWLHPSAWNTGIVLTAGRAVIEILTQKVPSLPIYNRVMPDNTRMLRICKSYGFEKTDTVFDTHANGHQAEFDLLTLNTDKWVPFKDVVTY